MASILLGFQSGGTPLVSGNIFSGTISPYAEVRLYNSISSSGSAYVGMATSFASGGITTTSGGDFSSGGLADGMDIPPNGRYDLPRLVCSGQINKLYATVVAGVSGRVRLFWDAF